MNIEKRTTHSSSETKKLAKELFDSFSNNENTALIFTLCGDLGSGKTHFTQGLAEALSIKDVVNSPTFVIEKIYKIENASYEHLIHIDAYRLQDSGELRALGWDDIIQRNNIIVVEWGDKVSDLIPKSAIKVSFETVDENTRTISWVVPE